MQLSHIVVIDFICWFEFRRSPFSFVRFVNIEVSVGPTISLSSDCLWVLILVSKICCSVFSTKCFRVFQVEAGVGSTISPSFDRLSFLVRVFVHPFSDGFLFFALKLVCERVYRSISLLCFSTACDDAVWTFLMFLFEFRKIAFFPLCCLMLTLVWERMCCLVFPAFRFWFEFPKSVLAGANFVLILTVVG